MIQYLEEADQSVALASAIDTTNCMYAVSIDSDYLVYRFDLEDDVEYRRRLGPIPALDLLPLEGGDGKDDNNNYYYSVLQELVLTRKDVAYASQILEELVLEASLVIGNDYTSGYLRSKLNFIQENFDGEHL